MSEIEIEIDGKTLKAAPNSMVIQVADAAGIYIPRFCYHKHLSVAANCRMCLVDVEKAPKPLPACATPVMPGMKVWTRSQKALLAQKAVMEFLLINHPLDCPICDQGGECELQDLSMGYGSPDSYYHQAKRSVKDKDLGPLISSEMTRCIQCTRCVRFGDEVAGLRELGATGRGEHMEIGTYVQQALQSEVSGNIIDLCPVGALTSKPFRFTARAWELMQYPSIAAHDGVGSNINVHTRNGTVMRVVPRENAAINETWISDRDRYSYQALYHADRVAIPKIKMDNEWHDTDWEVALDFVAKSLQQVADVFGKEMIGALVSPSATTEEYYLLQKILRKIGSNHIDHRLRQVDVSDDKAMPLFPGLETSMVDLEKQDLIMLIGSDIQREQPSLALRVRKAYRNEAKVMAINMMDYRFHFKTFLKNIVAPHEMVQALLSLAKALEIDEFQKLDHPVSESAKAMALQLKSAKNITLLLGAPLMQHPASAQLRNLSYRIAKALGAKVGMMAEGANAAGAWLGGAVPHRLPAGVPLPTPGLDAHAMVKNSRKAYVLFNVEPDFDGTAIRSMQQALGSAEVVIALSMFHHPLLEDYADVILPITPFTETSGTFVNASGEWQTFQGAATPFGESRPGWKVLRALGNFLRFEGFEYESSEEVLKELKSLNCQAKAYQIESLKWSNDQSSHKLSRIGDIPIYAGDSLVRRADALQATQLIVEGELKAARVNPDFAAARGWKVGNIIKIKQQNVRVELPVIYDERVPVDAVFMAGAILGQRDLPELFGAIEVES